MDNHFQGVGARFSFAQSFFRHGFPRLVALLSALCLTLIGTPALAQAKHWHMALIPYLSPNVLIPLFQPLARHLEKDGGRKVELYTAPNIRTHVERILQPEYDVIFTAPHMGRLSQLDAGYVPIGGFERPLTGVISVRKKGNIHSVEQLRGKSVAINDRLVLNSILTLAALEHRSIGQKDITIIPAASQNSALLSVAAGDVDAAITVNFALDQIPRERQQELRVIFRTDETPSIPSTLILVHPQMPIQERQKLQAALMRFPETDDGKLFLTTSSFRGVVRIEPEQLKKLDAYLPELRRLLAIQPGS